MYDLRVVAKPREWVRAWKPVVPGIREVFHARFVDHAYPRHTHDTWTVFVVDEGAIRYDLEARRRGAGGARVTLLPPHIVHDGRAATAAGFRKRVLYIETSALDERLIGPAVDEPDVSDPALVHELHALHRALGETDDALEAEERFAGVTSRLRRHLGDRSDTEPGGRSRVATNLRDLLDEHRFEPFTLAEASRTLHVSPAQLVRCFTRAFGIAPHQYVLARRIDAARRGLLEGDSVAGVAARVGFHDQAHLTRHFRRHVGTTPARFAGAR